MMNLLLKNQLKILSNSIRTQRWQNIIGFIVGMLVFGIMLFLMGTFVWSISDEVTPMILESILSVGFLVVIGFVILMGLPQIFKSLYSGSDLEMLFAMPIPTRNIFWVKYIQSYFGIPLFVFTIFAVPLVVYGIAIQAHFLYYIIVLLVLFVMTVIGLSVIYLLNLLLIQVMPPSRANEFMTVMSFLSGIIVYLIIVMPNMSSDVSMSERLLSGLPVVPDWVPVSWGSSAVSSALEGSVTAFLPLGMLLLLALIMAILTTLLVEKGFRTGWVRLSERSSKKQGKRKKAGVPSKLNHPITAIAKKEWYSVKRDLREWLTLMPILFILVFGLIGFITGGGSLADIRGHGNISWPIAQVVLLFILALTNGMISASSIGREGPNLWVTQVMPISGQQLAYGKFLMSWLLPLFVVFILEIILALFIGWTIWQFVLGIIVKAIITTGMSALGLWIGTLGAKYNPMNPQQRLNFWASILLFVLSHVYLFIAFIPLGYLTIPEVALNEIPQDLEHGITGFTGVLATIVLSVLSFKVNYPVLTVILGISVLLLFSLGLTYVFLLLSARQIDRGLKIDMVSQTSTRSLRRPGGRV